ncbi:hypothetical protein D3C85_1450920 [compost metagenome]
MKPPSKVMKLTGSPCSSSSSSMLESADSTSRWPVRGSTPSAERLRRSSSSLGSGCFSPLSGLRPSVFQVYSLGGRSSPMTRRWRSGSQATASKPLLLFTDGPRSWLWKSAWFNAVVCASTLTTVRSCRRSSVIAR